MRESGIYQMYLKNLLDRLLALVGTAALSWLLILLGIAIHLDSPGPIFFRQKRAGKNGTYFYIYKFRTMRIDTPHDMQTHIDIWFNGICKHKVRADFLQKPLIVPQQLCLGKRIHATSVHGYGNTLDSHFPKIFFMPDKWHGKNHFMLFLQGFHQFFAKLPEHIRMIGYN